MSGGDDLLPTGAATLEVTEIGERLMERGTVAGGLGGGGTTGRTPSGGPKTTGCTRNFGEHTTAWPVGRCLMTLGLAR